jgi:hypothetical protein
MRASFRCASLIASLLALGCARLPAASPVNIEPLMADPAALVFNDAVIRYKEKFAGDEMKLVREAGDFATEQIVVKRVKAPALVE